jgi:hypothetical protein
MAQKSASEIRELNTREKKCWRVIDQLLSPKLGEKVPAIVRFAAAEFVLKRLYPEKKIIGGDGIDGEIVIRIEKGNPEQGKNGSHVQAPRFAVPYLQ